MTCEEFTKLLKKADDQIIKGLRNGGADRVIALDVIDILARVIKWGAVRRLGMTNDEYVASAVAIIDAMAFDLQPEVRAWFAEHGVKT